MCGYLSWQLREEVLITCERPQAVQEADGRGQRLQFITTTVKLLQQRQTEAQRQDTGLNINVGQH